jgi:hypothetical protein
VQPLVPIEFPLVPIEFPLVPIEFTLVPIEFPLVKKPAVQAVFFQDFPTQVWYYVPYFATGIVSPSTEFPHFASGFVSPSIEFPHFATGFVSSPKHPEVDE